MLKCKMIIRRLLRELGLDLVRYPDQYTKARSRIFKLFDVDLVVDVGANKGQYLQKIRELGYEGDVLCIEPLQDAVKFLKEKFAKDTTVSIVNCAIGAQDGIVEINVASNSHSSSILDMMDLHLKNAPDSVYIGKERVELRSIGSLLDDLSIGNRNLYLKVDTQGYEAEVLKGLGSCLNQVRVIQLELSLAQLYQGQITFNSMIEILCDLGFSLYSIEYGFSDISTGRMLQVDGFFVKTNLLNSDKL